MRLMGMEAVYRRPRTSVASPEHRIFPYLLRDLEISRADHVWCADITYVPVTRGFFYLVAVVDRATRQRSVTTMARNEWGDMISGSPARFGRRLRMPRMVQGWSGRASKASRPGARGRKKGACFGSPLTPAAAR